MIRSIISCSLIPCARLSAIRFWISSRVRISSWTAAIAFRMSSSLIVSPYSVCINARMSASLIPCARLSAISALTASIKDVYCPSWAVVIAFKISSSLIWSPYSALIISAICSGVIPSVRASAILVLTSSIKDVYWVSCAVAIAVMMSSGLIWSPYCAVIRSIISCSLIPSARLFAIRSWTSVIKDVYWFA